MPQMIYPTIYGHIRSAVCEEPPHADSDYYTPSAEVFAMPYPEIAIYRRRLCRPFTIPDNILGWVSAALQPYGTNHLQIIFHFIP